MGLAIEFARNGDSMNAPAVLFATLGLLLSASPSFATALKVNGDLSLVSSGSQDVMEFRVGEKSLGPTEIVVTRIDTAKFQKSCATQALETIKRWSRKGLDVPALTKAIADYNAEVAASDANAVSTDIYMDARFAQSSYTMDAATGIRRLAPLPYLHYLELALSLGSPVTPYSVNVSSKDLSTDERHGTDVSVCGRTALPQAVVKALIEKIEKETENRKREKILHN